jgi:mediator of RNA polymerase II transcription subunit 31
MIYPSNDEERFNIELEFVQNLCNAKYLNYLAQNGYFEDEKFMNFLKYLYYWKEPKYMKFLVYPQCLIFLENLVENSAFRKELVIPQFIEYIYQQQGFHWMLKFEPTKKIIDVGEPAK